MLLKVPAQVVRGFCMGAADIVPGVSGGTVALLLGIYTELVASIRQGAVAMSRFVKLDVRDGIEQLRRVDWWFLIPLLAGIGLAIITLAHLIETLLEERPVEMAAVFFGLVVASIVVAWRHVARRDPLRIAVLVAVAVITFFVLGLRSGPVDEPSLWFIFVAGAIAICAMILPGISGSFLLLMLGLYETVLGAVSDRDLALIAVFGVGCVLGLALFSSLLDWALNNHYDTVMAGLVGLMAGSLRVLWPWPEGTATTDLAAPSGDWLVPLVLALVAAAVVLVVAALGARSGTRAEARETLANN